MSQPSTSPYPFLTGSVLWACGRQGQRGTVVIQDGDLSARIALPPALFQLLVILMQAAKREPAGEDWVPTGFLTVEELRREITRQAGGNANHPDVDSENVIRAIYKLRQRINKALFPKMRRPGFAKLLLETTVLGYRLSTAPENLNLVLLP